MADAYLKLTYKLDVSEEEIRIIYYDRKAATRSPSDAK